MSAARRLGVGMALVLSALMSACLPAGVKLPQSPYLKYLTPRSGRIAYIGTDGNVYTIDQAGEHKQSVTTDGGGAGGQGTGYWFPTWSPDSQKLAFIKVSQSTDGTTAAGVETAASDGTKLAEAYTSTDTLPVYLYWSPDGKHLSFLSTTGSGQFTMQITPAEGGKAQELDSTSPTFWSWAPNGQSLLVHAGGSDAPDSPERVSILTTGGSGDEKGLGMQPAPFNSPAWSPQGDRLLLAAKTEQDNNGLILSNPTGTVTKTLATLDHAAAFSWSPDGKSIAYTVNSDDNPPITGKLTVMNPDKPNVTVSTEAEDVLGFFWSPDSKKIAYYVPRLLQPPSNSQGGTSSSNTTVLLHLYIMDVASGKSRELMTFVPSKEFMNIIIPAIDQYQRSATIWSPDSKNLLVTGYLAGDKQQISNLYIVSAAGNLEPRQLVEAKMAFWSWK